MTLKKLFLATLCCGALLANSAHAAQWPEAPLHVIVPFPAGSSPDTTARVIGQRLSEKLGQPVVVENKPGAGGNIGTGAIARAKPDGYTIGVSIAGPLAVNPMLYKHLPYDPARDFALITVAVTQPSVLAASPSMHVKDMKQFLAAVRSSAKYNYGSTGVGSISQLAVATLLNDAGAQAVHVPYAGANKALLDLLGGQVQFGALPAGLLVSQVRNGKLVPLAVATAHRSKFLPQIPTLGESGFPEIQADAWIGYVAPAGTPAAIVSRLHDDIVAILKEPEVQNKLEKQLMEPVGNTPAEFRKMLDADAARWKPIIEKDHITAD